MKITIKFSEIQSLVKAKSGREVVLSAVDEQTVKAEAKVSVKVPLLGEISKTVGLKVKVERIDGNELFLKYDGGLGTDMIINGLLTFIASTPAKKIVEKMQGNGIFVHLDGIEEARKVLEMVKLTGILFHEDHIAVEGQLRMA